MKQDELRGLVEIGVIQNKPDVKILKSELTSLVKDGLIQNLPNDFFAFSNNLTWEVIYETLLYAERRHLHSVVAKHIEQFNAENLEAVASLLLHHYTGANNWEKCVFYSAKSGDRAARMFAIDDALDTYNKIFDALEKLPGDTAEDKCLVYEKLGDVYLSCGQDQNARDKFIKSLDYWREHDFNTENVLTPWSIELKTQESVLCRKISMAYLGMADYEESMAWVDEAIEKLPYRPGRIASQVYASKGGTYYRKGQFKESIEWVKKALSIAKRLKSNQDIAFAYYALANSYMWGGKFKQAITQLEQASLIYDQMNDIVGQSKTINNIGICNHLLGNLNKALIHYNKATTLLKRIHHEAGIALLNNNIGEILLIRGQVNEAIQNFSMTVDTFDAGKCEKPLAGLALVNICRCHRVNRQFDKAEEALAKGTILVKEVGSDALIIESKLDLAELYLDMEKYDKAIDQSRENLDSLEKLDIAPLLVRARRIMGIALTHNGQIEDALSCLQESTKLAKKINAELEEAKSIIAYTAACIRSNTQDKKLNKLLKYAVSILENMGAELDLAQAKDLQTKLISE